VQATSPIQHARLSEKPVIAVGNKIDALDDPDRLARLRAHVETLGVPFYSASGATGEGVDALLEAVWREVAAARDRASSGVSEPQTALREPQDGPERGRRTANREPRSVIE
jgi:50S ribosomal subunit-associated GTPase HflX